ncbi:MAG: sugar ABC transporter substrate-binding protein [Geobacter sp.]|nr:sugar ABC transporter substrate-binding protein [Geobacter sp.]
MRQALITVLFLMIFPVASYSADYVIGEGDGLDIAVWGVRELNASVRVRPDGKITLPGLGDVIASGLTPKSLQDVLSEKLKELVKNPIVTVTVREITNSRVYFFGGGINSGVYDLNRRTTLLQLLCVVAGNNGPAASAPVAGAPVARSPDFKKAYLLRNGKKIKEDFYNLFITGDVSEDIIIDSNDLIFIPQLQDKSVYVFGAVNAPKAIEYREGITVMDAILEAGGFTRFASQNDTEVKRKSGSKEETIQVRAKDITKSGDMSQNIKLKSGDYVIVKESIF